MTTSSLQQQVEAFTETQKLIAALLALAGEPMGKSRIVLHLAEMGIVIPATTLDDDVKFLKALGVLTESVGRGFAIVPEAVWPAIRTALYHGMFAPLRQVYEKINPLRTNWEGNVVLRSYRQGVALLRMALIAGDGGIL